MARVINDSNIGVGSGSRKKFHLAAQLRQRQIELGIDGVEPCAIEKFAHRGGVTPGIGERRNVLVFGHAQYQRDALLGESRSRSRNESSKNKDDDPCAQIRFPIA